MPIQLPIEIWQLADRYSEAVQSIARASNVPAAVDSAIELSSQLQSLVDPYLTTDVTIETSNDLLLTFYRDPLNLGGIYVLATQKLSRPPLDRPSSEPLGSDRPPSQ
jgi:hypothetical protein